MIGSQRESNGLQSRLVAETFAATRNLIALNSAKDDDSWREPYGGLASYSRTFGPIIDRYLDKSLWRRVRRYIEDDEGYNHALEELLDNVSRRKSGTPRVLDLMSFGAFHASLDLPGTAVGLLDEREPSLRARHRNIGVEFIPGDIHNPRLWEQLRQSTRERGQYDVVIARPLGALKKVQRNKITYGQTLSRMYRLLDLNSGVLLTQYDSLMGTEVSEVVDRLNALQGLTALMDNASGTFMLVSGNGAPDPRTFRNIVMRGQ